MAKPKTPTIPDEKIEYFRDQLYRELSHMFEWTGLPQTVPQDYLERNLVKHGYVLYYKDSQIGQDVLRCEITGQNRHELPITARTTISSHLPGEPSVIDRNIKRLADSEDAQTDFDELKDGVLIRNMPHGQNMSEIVDFFATRLALAQQAFDTNLLWANVPYIFQTDSDDTRLSIEKLFADIFSGTPFTIVDKSLFKDNKERTGVPSGIQYIGKELMDTQNEIMMKFRETVGFNTAGVDKAERVNTLEIKSNDQHTKSVLEIMLYQRKQACEAINAFFNVALSVELVGQEELEELPEDPLEGGEEDGTGDGGTEEFTQE